jgi:hypothetical protein
MLRLLQTHFTKEFITGPGNKVKKSPFQKQIQKLEDRIEQGKNQDIKRELRKGNIVIIIEDSLD